MSYTRSKDPVETLNGRADKFGRKSRAITNDGSDFPVYANILVTTAGTLAVLPALNADNSWVDLGTVPALYIPPFLVRAVQAGSTAVCVTIED